MKISRFIDEEKRAWHEVMVQELFQPKEATMVMVIPLSKVALPDKLIWTDSVIGQVSVKSAYFQERMFLGKELTPYEERSPTWRALRTAKVIPKVKMFA